MGETATIWKEELNRISEYLQAQGIECSFETIDNGPEGIAFYRGEDSSRTTWVIAPSDDSGYLAALLMGRELDMGNTSESQAKKMMKAYVVFCEFNARKAAIPARGGTVYGEMAEGADYVPKYVLRMPLEAYADSVSFAEFLNSAQDYFSEAIEAVNDERSPEMAFAELFSENDEAGEGEASCPQAASRTIKPASEPVTAESTAVPAASASSTAPANTTQSATVVPEAPSYASAPKAASAPTNDSPAAAEPKEAMPKWQEWALALVSFLIPLIGLVLYFVWKKSKPELAKRLAWSAVCGVALQVIISFM